MKMFRLYSSERLKNLKYSNVIPSNKDPIDFEHPSDLLNLSEDVLSKIESNQIGDVKLFGENSLFLNNTKSIWFDKESKMDDIFLTEDEFYFFI